MLIEVTQIVQDNVRDKEISNIINTDLVERVVWKEQGMTICLQSGMSIDVKESYGWYKNKVGVRGSS